MSPVVIVLVVVGLVVGVGVGYDAERWGRNINGWSLAGAFFSVVALGAWLLVRHQEAERRRAAGRAAERLGTLGALDAARQSQIRESQNVSCDDVGQERII